MGRKSDGPRVRHVDETYDRIRPDADPTKAGNNTERYLTGKPWPASEPQPVPDDRAPRLKQLAKRCAIEGDLFSALLYCNWHWVRKACDRYDPPDDSDNYSWPGVSFDEDEFAQRLAVRLWTLHRKHGPQDAGKIFSKDVWQTAEDIRKGYAADKRGAGMYDSYTDAGLTPSGDERHEEYASDGIAARRANVDIDHRLYGKLIPEPSDDMIAADRLRCATWKRLLANLPNRKVEAFRRHYVVHDTPWPEPVSPMEPEQQKEIAADMGVSPRAVRGWLRDVAAYLDAEWPSALQDGWRIDCRRLYERKYRDDVERLGKANRNRRERLTEAQAEFEALPLNPYSLPHAPRPVLAGSRHLWTFEVMLARDDARPRRGQPPMSEGSIASHSGYPLPGCRSAGRIAPVVHLWGPDWLRCSNTEYRDMLDKAWPEAERRFRGEQVNAVSPLLPEPLLLSRRMWPKEYDPEARRRHEAELAAIPEPQAS